MTKEKWKTLGMPEKMHYKLRLQAAKNGRSIVSELRFLLNLSKRSSRVLTKEEGTFSHTTEGKNSVLFIGEDMSFDGVRGPKVIKWKGK